MVKNIFDQHEILLKQKKKVVKEAEAVGDENSIDIIKGYIGNIEKSSWMLAA